VNRDSFLTVLLAVCCIGAAGMASTTLASSLTEDPDDVVDIDYSKVPIGKDDGNSVKGAVQNEEGTPQGGTSNQDSESSGGETGKRDGESAPSDSSEQSDGDSGQDTSDEPGPEAGSGGEPEEPGSGPGDGKQLGGSGPSGEGPGTGPLSLLEQLWRLLEQLLPLLVLLLALALVYRYRRNLLALVLAIAAVLGDRAERHAGSETTWPSEQPSNEVHRAWLKMVDRLDIDEPQTRTPSECASAAVDANMDPTAVQTLTNVFEEVRYGEKPVTDERRQRARKGLQRLGGGETR
jgi:hypothetical protein